MNDAAQRPAVRHTAPKQLIYLAGADAAGIVLGARLSASASLSSEILPCEKRTKLCTKS